MTQKSQIDLLNTFRVLQTKLMLEYQAESKYLQNRQIKTFYLSQSTALEIEDAIVHLKDNGCGLYNFSTDLLINVKSDISTTLANVFNLCTD